MPNRPADDAVGLSPLSCQATHASNDDIPAVRGWLVVAGWVCAARRGSLRRGLRCRLPGVSGRLARGGLRRSVRLGGRGRLGGLHRLMRRRGVMHSVVCDAVRRGGSCFSKRHGREDDTGHGGGDECGSGKPRDLHGGFAPASALSASRLAATNSLGRDSVGLFRGVSSTAGTTDRAPSGHPSARRYGTCHYPPNRE